MKAQLYNDLHNNGAAGYPVPTLSQTETSKNLCFLLQHLKLFVLKVGKTYSGWSSDINLLWLWYRGPENLLSTALIKQEATLKQPKGRDHNPSS